MLHSHIKQFEGLHRGLWYTFYTSHLRLRHDSLPKTKHRVSSGKVMIMAINNCSPKWHSGCFVNFKPQTALTLNNHIRECGCRLSTFSKEEMFIGWRGKSMSVVAQCFVSRSNSRNNIQRNYRASVSRSQSGIRHVCPTKQLKSFRQAICACAMCLTPQITVQWREGSNQQQHTRQRIPLNIELSLPAGTRHPV